MEGYWCKLIIFQAQEKGKYRKQVTPQADEDKGMGVSWNPKEPHPLLHFAQKKNGFAGLFGLMALALFAF